ncbi:MAG: DUF2271 domain-containing protein [Myxococcota bacterium]|nr:DUF2271 domain-containing protein [Myxococcota bacterium]
MPRFRRPAPVLRCAALTFFSLVSLVSLAGCTSYQPVFELWPTSDASLPGITASSGSVGSSGASGSGAVAPVPDASAGTDVTASSGFDAAGPASSGGDAGGPADASAQTPMGDAGRVNGACSLSVTVTTVTNNGGYSPHNIGAIWVAQGSGTFVKTLAVWAKARISHLTLWNTTTTAAGARQNTVDAVTGATLSSHQTHKVSWNCTDTKGTMVPDGPYRIYFEMTDDNVTGPSAFVDFTKGSQPLSLAPADTPHFVGINLSFVP